MKKIRIAAREAERAQHFTTMKGNFFFLPLQHPLCSISILISGFETICFEPLYSTLKIGFYSIISSIYQVSHTAFPIMGKRIGSTVPRGILKMS